MKDVEFRPMKEPEMREFVSLHPKKVNDFDRSACVLMWRVSDDQLSGQTLEHIAMASDRDDPLGIDGVFFQLCSQS